MAKIKSTDVSISKILGEAVAPDTSTGQYFVTDNKITEIASLDSSVFTDDDYLKWIKTLETSPMKQSSPVDVYHVTPYDKFTVAEDPSMGRGFISDTDASIAFYAFMDLMRAEGKDPSSLANNAFKNV